MSACVCTQYIWLSMAVIELSITPILWPLLETTVPWLMAKIKIPNRMTRVQHLRSSTANKALATPVSLLETRPKMSRSLVLRPGFILNGISQQAGVDADSAEPWTAEPAQEDSNKLNSSKDAKSTQYQECIIENENSIQVVPELAKGDLDEHSASGEGDSEVDEDEADTTDDVATAIRSDLIMFETGVIAPCVIFGIWVPILLVILPLVVWHHLVAWKYAKRRQPSVDSRQSHSNRDIGTKPSNSRTPTYDGRVLGNGGVHDHDRCMI